MGLREVDFDARFGKPFVFAPVGVLVLTVGEELGVRIRERAIAEIARVEDVGVVAECVHFVEKRMSFEQQSSPRRNPACHVHSEGVLAFEFGDLIRALLDQLVEHRKETVAAEAEFFEGRVVSEAERALDQHLEFVDGDGTVNVNDTLVVSCAPGTSGNGGFSEAVVESTAVRNVAKLPLLEEPLDTTGFVFRNSVAVLIGDGLVGTNTAKSGEFH